ncbi:hypothetical protein BX666DRAFT_1870358 [Dichotomocladium elegans]|nr:hypothetical protein BX666DRAFT_1870358 [Dichotomocladium elegans]
MASSSYHRPLIGHVGKILKAIPVVRPQDIVHPGRGVVVYDPSENPLVLRGLGTQFVEEVRPRDFVYFGAGLKGHVARVVSDTHLELTHAIPNAQKGAYESFRVSPHVDQSGVFREVHDTIFRHECVTVFPEGGSHDRSEMLPLKAGFAIMALGALAEQPDLPLKIVPVGLNYFHPDRFRSRAVVSFGQPLEVDPADVEKYRQGGKAKREAITHVLDQSDEAFRAVTVNAPDFDTLLVIQAARRLYAGRKQSIDEAVQLDRNFVTGWSKLRGVDATGEMDTLMRKVRLYNDTLSFFGIRDHQVDKLDITPVRAAALLIQRLCKLAVLGGLGAPAFLLNLPLIWATDYISKKKQRGKTIEALAGSMVKITGKDVLATWKIIVAGVAAPMLYGLYSLIFLNRMVKRRPELSMMQKLVRACLSWAGQPILYYILLRLGDMGLDIYKSIKPLFLAVRNPEVSQLLKIMRKDLSKDVTAFVHKHHAVFFPSGL